MLLRRKRFPEANCPKKQFSHKSGEGHECGRFCPNTHGFFWGLLAKTFWFLSWIRSGLVGGSIPPGPVSLGRSFSCVCACVSCIWRARGVRHNFGILSPSPIFPKICHYFGTLTPSRAQFSQNSATIFGTFHEYKLWELSFCVSVIVNLPHATVAIVKSL